MQTRKTSPHQKQREYISSYLIIDSGFSFDRMRQKLNATIETSQALLEAKK